MQLTLDLKKISFKISQLQKNYLWPDTILVCKNGSLQLIDLSKRASLLLNLYKSLKEGGGLLIFEKTRQNNTRTNDILNQLYTDFKLKKISKDENYYRFKIIGNIVRDICNSLNKNRYKITIDTSEKIFTICKQMIYNYYLLES